MKNNKWLNIAGFIALVITLWIWADHNIPKEIPTNGTGFNCPSEENGLHDWKVTDVATDSSVVLVTSEKLPNVKHIAFVKSGTNLVAGEPVKLLNMICKVDGVLNEEREFYTAVRQ